MNRSVVSWLIATGVLCAGTAIAGAPPATADPTGPAVSDGTNGPGDDGASGRRLRGHASAPAQPGSAGTPMQRPCPWPVLWPVDLPVPPRDSIIIGQPAFASAPGVPSAPISGEVPDDLPDISLDVLLAPEAEPPVVPIAPTPAVLSPVLSPVSAQLPLSAQPPATNDVLPQVFPAPINLPMKAGPIAPVPRKPVPARVPAAVAPQSPPISGDSPPERLGYPDSLRNADIAAVAAQALPGLAAILGMTALGGFLGYRQARAGYLLRAAGAARFLQ